MRVAKLTELLKNYPADAVVAPKAYSEGADGITLELYTLSDKVMIKRLGGIDIPFQELVEGATSGK